MTCFGPLFIVAFASWAGKGFFGGGTLKLCLAPSVPEGVGGIFTFFAPDAAPGSSFNLGVTGIPIDDSSGCAEGMTGLVVTEPFAFRAR